jgi:hypothetical protein
MVTIRRVCQRGRLVAHPIPQRHRKLRVTCELQRHAGGRPQEAFPRSSSCRSRTIHLLSARRGEQHRLGHRHNARHHGEHCGGIAGQRGLASLAGGFAVWGSVPEARSTRAEPGPRPCAARGCRGVFIVAAPFLRRPGHAGQRPYSPWARSAPAICDASGSPERALAHRSISVSCLPIAWTCPTCRWSRSQGFTAIASIESELRSLTPCADADLRPAHRHHSSMLPDTLHNQVPRLRQISHQRPAVAQFPVALASRCPTAVSQGKS